MHHGHLCDSRIITSPGRSIESAKKCVVWDWEQDVTSQANGSVRHSTPRDKTYLNNLYLTQRTETEPGTTPAVDVLIS